MDIDPVMLNRFTEHLLSMPGARYAGHEITMRCPFCGDSSSNKSKTSFYINIDPNSDNFLCYNCFRATCAVAGVADIDLFDVLQYNDHESQAYLIKSVRNAIKNNSIGGYVTKKRKALYIPPVEDCVESQLKLKYINKRLGLDLTYADINDLKITFDIARLFDANDSWDNINRPEYIDTASKYCIGFVSAYNDYVIARDISKSMVTGKRYNNIKIFKHINDEQIKAYCIPTTIDILSTEPIVINIAEGPFDILGVYYHFSYIDSEYKNRIYIASCGGASIINTVMEYVKEYGLLNLRVNIFSDSDVDVSKYTGKKGFERYQNLFSKLSVRVYYNDIGKDYGVPKDQIQLRRMTLI